MREKKKKEKKVLEFMGKFSLPLQCSVASEESEVQLLNPDQMLVHQGTEVMG